MIIFCLILRMLKLWPVEPSCNFSPDKLLVQQRIWCFRASVAAEAHRSLAPNIKSWLGENNISALTYLPERLRRY